MSQGFVPTDPKRLLDGRFKTGEFGMRIVAMCGLANLTPEFVATRSSPGGERKNDCLRELLGDALQRMAQLVCGQAVALGSQDHKWPVDAGQKS